MSRCPTVRNDRKRVSATQTTSARPPRRAERNALDPRFERREHWIALTPNQISRRVPLFTNGQAGSS
jgi:hypothetical protein